MNNTQGLGSLRYKDISGPDGVPDGKISPEYDRTFLGGSLPRFMYGGTISLAYKNIDLSMAFQGIGKQNVLLHQYMWENMNIFDGNYWSSFKSDAENANAFYPRLSSNSLQADAPVWNGSMSDHWLFNGRYFRMKNITVGWTLPKAWMEKVHMRSARLYVSGNDLFSIDQYPKGWDPETPVVDKVPVTSSVIFGLQVNF